MGTMAEIQNYENMISALNAFSQQVFEASGQMLSAGQACVSGTNGDESAVKANAKLQTLRAPIQEICADAKRIAQALFQEMEEIKRAAAIVNSFD